MQRDEYMRAIQMDTARITADASIALEARVSACPEWTVGQLIQHLGEVYEFITEIVATRARDEELEVEPLHNRQLELRRGRSEAFASSAQILPWLHSCANRLVDVLGSVNPGEPVWTWWGPEQRAGFWQRRMAQETAVHRWDVQAATGEPEPIDRALAADGVDEALTVHAPERRSECDETGNGETYLFRSTDTADEWWVRLGETDLVYERRPADAGVEVSGTACDLLLFLWQRTGREALDVRGDAALLDRWFALVPPE